MIGLRIKEERERLSLTQQGMADAIGVAKRTFIDWEKDRTSPTAVQLSALSALGVDVLYVVTGFHNTSAPALRPELTRRKSTLLDNYDHLSESDKAALERTAFALAEQGRVSRKGKTA
ncbi:helix-turn-helix domain-containing protein [Candidatus Symbiopectobacterium endolongispinus]|uniref:helix-turn-helix domain-containing protein n=1 Tax=Candidatus Symbiopectobacterium endolongispinus TaxID=2812664 RepID=UPI00207932CC|nr:helix-turn-helix domain-containing protein [Candidatus Symbiopectobacterium endolongispinus]MBT9428447.1 helix-turn-helix domain-containing protein [Candidatus Symbiopectobacterium endolongispinus]